MDLSYFARLAIIVKEHSTEVYYSTMCHDDQEVASCSCFKRHIHYFAVTAVSFNFAIGHLRLVDHCCIGWVCVIGVARPFDYYRTTDCSGADSQGEVRLGWAVVHDLLEAQTSSGTNSREEDRPGSLEVGLLGNQEVDLHGSEEEGPGRRNCCSTSVVKAGTAADFNSHHCYYSEVVALDYCFLTSSGGSVGFAVDYSSSWVVASYCCYTVAIHRSSIVDCSFDWDPF